MKFQITHLEKIGSDPILLQWRRFVLKTTMSRVAKPLKKLTLVYKPISSDEFIDYMKPKLQHFVKRTSRPSGKTSTSKNASSIFQPT